MAERGVVVTIAKVVGSFGLLAAVVYAFLFTLGVIFGGDPRDAHILAGSSAIGILAFPFVFLVLAAVLLPFVKLYYFAKRRLK